MIDRLHWAGATCTLRGLKVWRMAGILNSTSTKVEPAIFWSLATALLSGFQVAYSVDESEVNGFLFPVPGEPSRRRILLYEVDEGGAGLMLRISRRRNHAEHFFHALTLVDSPLDYP